MNQAVIERLLDLNAEFYQTFAFQFSQTRLRLQPGVQRILARLDPNATLLDLGCGNGQLARALIRQGFRGRYLGLDFSEGLLHEARAGLAAMQPPSPGGSFEFLACDLARPGWSAWLPPIQPTVILAFAVLHHLPGANLRRQRLRELRALLPPNGCFIHSNWQFLESARLRARLQPWEAAGLSQAEVEPGDYLLDWRRGGRGLRYVHHFSESELTALAAETGFHIHETFSSDGENGALGLYQVWQPAAPGG